MRTGAVLRRASVAAAVLLAGCGAEAPAQLAPAPGVRVQIAQHLDGLVHEVELLVFGAQAQCPSLERDAAIFRGSPACEPSQYDGVAPCTVSRISVPSGSTNDQGEPGAMLHVPVGSRSILAIGVDAAGGIVVTDCAGPLDVVEAGVVDAALVLE